MLHAEREANSESGCDLSTVFRETESEYQSNYYGNLVLVTASGTGSRHNAACRNPSIETRVNTDHGCVERRRFRFGFEEIVLEFTASRCLSLASIVGKLLEAVAVFLSG